MKYAEVLKIVAALNDDNAKNDAMVYQVFEDGEITLQKGGDLLWQRTLHCVASGRNGAILKHEDMPHHMRSSPHGYIFCKDKHAANAARTAIFSLEA